jgi:hypothetical protein
MGFKEVEGIVKINTILSVDLPEVDTILYHEPDNIDPTHYADVTYTDGSELRHFNLEAVAIKISREGL